MSDVESLPTLDRANAVARRAPGRDLSEIHAGRANSGKWHLTGDHGCPNSSINANINATQPVTKLSDGRRDWCYYCEMQLQIYRQQAEIDRLRNLVADDSEEADRNV